MTAQQKEIFELMILTVSLGIDVFLVAASLGASKVSLSLQKRFVMYVGCFHLLFSLAGILLGTYLHNLMGNVSEIVGAIIIIATGTFFLINAIRSSKGIDVTFDPNAISLALAVSMECFSIGIGVSMHLHIIVGMLLCFTAAGLLSGYIGLRIGRTIGSSYGMSADIVGSLCLITVGVLFWAW
ncbi:MAG: manganese efflux pump MntP family protein [Alicyclobacillus sp.]|nr:manganese efflux pump MntP family protein [Alicyclobacillus sp.]